MANRVFVRLSSWNSRGTEFMNPLPDADEADADSSKVYQQFHAALPAVPTSRGSQQGLAAAGLFAPDPPSGGAGGVFLTMDSVDDLDMPAVTNAGSAPPAYPHSAHHRAATPPLPASDPLGLSLEPLSGHVYDPLALADLDLGGSGDLAGIPALIDGLALGDEPEDGVDGASPRSEPPLPPSDYLGEVHPMHRTLPLPGGHGGDHVQRRSARAHRPTSYRDLAAGASETSPRAGGGHPLGRRHSADVRGGGSGTHSDAGGRVSRAGRGRLADDWDEGAGEEEGEEGLVVEEGDEADEDYGPGAKKRKQKRKTSPVPKRRNSPVPGRMEPAAAGGALDKGSAIEPACPRPIPSDKPAGSTSMLKGVSRHRLTGKWEACLWAQRRQIYLGGFDSELTAGRAYDIAALIFKGPDANTNFDKGNYPDEMVDPLRGFTQEQLIAHLRAHPPVLLAPNGKVL